MPRAKSNSYLWRNDKSRLRRSMRRLNKSSRRLAKARAERIWIEENPHIHILNYPYYKFKRWLNTIKDEECE